MRVTFRFIVSLLGSWCNFDTLQLDIQWMEMDLDQNYDGKPATLMSCEGLDKCYGPDWPGNEQSNASARLKIPQDPIS